MNPKMQSAMKRYNLLLSILVLAPLWAIAQPKAPFTREFRERFPLSPQGEVDLDNRYGKIDVKTWDQPQMDILVTITVKNASQREAEDLFSRIRILFKKTGDLVSAQTIIDEDDAWWKGFRNRKSDYAIDYLVRMPMTASLKLHNRYGNVFVDKLEGDASLRLQYGNLKSGVLSGSNHLDLAYAKALCEAFGPLDLQMKYSKMDLGQGQDIRSKSGYSELKLRRAQSLAGEGKYDTYRLGPIRLIDLNLAYSDLQAEEAAECLVKARYTTIQLERLQKSLQADLAYGNLTIRHLDPAFEKVSVSGNYSDVRITAPDGGYRVEAETHYGGITLPAGFQTTTSLESGSKRVLRGHAGKGGLIGVSLKYGSLKVQERNGNH
jgi:hypothetical protein